MPYDTTPFISISIDEVVKTLGRSDGAGVPGHEPVSAELARDARFPRSWCRSHWPAPAWACGCSAFSINVLTMFGMVLAIGILVDDAIAVVENAERIMTEEGFCRLVKQPCKAMTQITSVIIGITLVLVAVFVPMAFFPGSTGRHLSPVRLTAHAVDRLLPPCWRSLRRPRLCATLLKSEPLHCRADAERATAGSANGPRASSAASMIGSAARDAIAIKGLVGGHSGPTAALSRRSLYCWWDDAVVVHAPARQLSARRGSRRDHHGQCKRRRAPRSIAPTKPSSRSAVLSRPTLLGQYAIRT